MPSASLTFDAADASVCAAGPWVIQLPVTPELPPLAEAPVRILDGAAITALDTGGAWKLLDTLHRAGDISRLEYRNFSPQHLAILNLVAQHYPATQAPFNPRADGLLAQLGRGTLGLVRNLAGLVDFVGRLVFELLTLARRPGHFRWRELGAQVQAVFVNAIPISAAMIFLLGVVFAYLMGVEAQKYGANLYVVDGVAAAVCRELSPVIVAILVAGRSGAAMTAQLGTMKVTEEIDAITTLGLSPYSVLVVPRLIALIVALPLLVFIGDVAGLLGGMVVAGQQLDISYRMFFDRLDNILELKTVLVGLGKAPVFALFIGMIACRMGFAAERDARSVGENTTSTVVQSIVAVILINAVFAIIFVHLDI